MGKRKGPDEEKLLDEIKEAGEVLDEWRGAPRKFKKAVDKIADAIEEYEDDD